MKIVKENNFTDIFPMKIKCERIVDKYGFSYGDEKDFCGSELEIEANDIKKHDWFKYPNYEGTDYGVVCPICKQFVVIEKDKTPSVILNNAKEIYLSE